MHQNPIEAVSDATLLRSSEGQAPETVQAKPTVSMPTAGPRPTTQTGALPATPEPELRHQDTWYAVKKGERVGPFKKEEILGLLLDGTLHERSFVWRPTMPAWKRMGDVPELSTIMEQFLEQQRKQHETRDTDTPPPLPETQKEFAKAPEVGRATAETVDKLFSQISTPQIDLRKASEVQPDEPDRSAPSQVEPTQAPKDARRTFFGRVLVLDETKWPETPSVLKEAQKTPSVLRREAPKLSEFSVLMRLSEASRKRAIVTYTIGVFFLGALVGAVMFFVFSKSPAERANRTMGFKRGEPTFEQVLYTVPKETSVVEEQTAQQPEKVAPSKPKPVEKPEVRQSHPTTSKLTVAEVEPELKNEFERYSALMQTSDEKLNPSQVVADFKPKTVTELPSRVITSESIENIFKLNWKRLASCKLLATRYRDTTMKVLIQFVVGKDGEIRDLAVEQEGGFLEEKVLQCIARNIKALRFPAQDNEIPVRWPMIF
jgi:hypothetical protein